MPPTKLFRLGLALGLLLPAVGCGPRLVTVTGRVAYPDGKPYTGGTVWFTPVDLEQNPLSGRGDVASDGTFRLGTIKPDEGIALGKYSVAVIPASDNAPELDTQGLEVTVVNGSNHFDVTVVPKGEKKSRKK